jgi:RNA polymerase sigma factor (sigma-70 family)
MTSANRGIVFQQIDRLYREGTLSGLGDSQLLERYLTRRDEAAFRALVDLHGPMVLGLCRRVLRDPRDIEDAFQATFLVLVRKAATIRDRGLLSNWLYGVAYRVARRARTHTLRRRGREIGFDRLDVSAASEATDIDGVGPALDQELNRLPAKYRATLVLCYFNGQTHDQAAEELGCPVGTVRSRLSRGRDLLRRRLIRRGRAPTAAIVGHGWDMPVRLGIESVPSALISSTVDAALAINAFQTLLAGAAAASVLALTQGVLTAMKLAQLKWIGMMILATSFAAGGVIAVAFAAGKSPKQATNLEEFTVKVADLEGQSGPQASNVTSPNKVALPNSNDPFQSSSILPNPAADSSRVVDLSNRSIRELEVELRLALNDDKRTEALARSASISAAERQQARGKVLLIQAKLDGLAEDLSDEIDRLKLESTKKDAELDRAAAQNEIKSVLLARNKRLNERKKGIVSEDEVTAAVAEHNVSQAQMSIVKVEKSEVELRIQQLQKRLGRIKEVVKLAEPAHEIKP